LFRCRPINCSLMACCPMMEVNCTLQFNAMGKNDEAMTERSLEWLLVRTWIYKN
jgi:hypothetical protein